MNQTPRLYGDLAWLWPIVSPPSDYAQEAAAIDALIVDRLGPEPQRVLDLGAGAGHTLRHLSRAGCGRHEATAVDLSPAMVDLFEDLMPPGRVVVGDMRDVRLGERFDVVMVHDAIDYLVEPEDVAAGLRTVAEHLEPNGLALIAPTCTIETFEPGASSMDVAPDEVGDAMEARGLRRVSYTATLGEPEADGGRFDLDLAFRLTWADGREEVIQDRHPCGLFSAERWSAMIRDAGLVGDWIARDGDEEDPPWSMFAAGWPG